MKEFKIKEKYNNKKVALVIQKEFPRLSLASLNKAFRVKDIKVNDIRVTKDFLVSTGDVIKLYINDDILYGIPNIDYIYEDENILIAYKPKGIECNKEKDSKSVIYFEELVKKQKGENICICHRLDLNTEGLVIFSKNESAYNEILQLFKERNISKEYIALVYGKLKKSHDILSNFIVKDSKTGFSNIVCEDFSESKSCITEYEVVKYISLKNCTILNIKLHTGRTHQIRVHMKYINHPVIGDSKYSTNEINDKFKLYSQILYASKYTFNFSQNSPLYYLNKVKIDISDKVIDKIYKLLNM